MEHSFGVPLDDVRVRVDESPRSIGAVAYASGTDIVMAPGHYDPSSSAGKSLLGHEIAHVVQQSSGQIAAPQGKGAAVHHDASLEAAADRAGEKVALGERVDEYYGGRGGVWGAQPAVQAKMQDQGSAGYQWVDAQGRPRNEHFYKLKTVDDQKTYEIYTDMTGRDWHYTIATDKLVPLENATNLGLGLSRSDRVTDYRWVAAHPGAVALGKELKLDAAKLLPPSVMNGGVTAGAGGSLTFIDPVTKAAYTAPAYMGPMFGLGLVYFAAGTPEDLAVFDPSVELQQRAVKTGFIDKARANKKQRENAGSVMGGSATDAFKDAIDEDTTTRFEWCHLIGHGDGGCEVAENFVSGSKNNNTLQLALEIAQRHIREKLSKLGQGGKFSLRVQAVLAPTAAADITTFTSYEVVFNGEHVATWGFPGVIHHLDPKMFAILVTQAVHGLIDRIFHKPEADASVSASTPDVSFPGGADPPEAPSSGGGSTSGGSSGGPAPMQE